MPSRPEGTSGRVHLPPAPGTSAQLLPLEAAGHELSQVSAYFCCIVNHIQVFQERAADNALLQTN